MLSRSCAALTLAVFFAGCGADSSLSLEDYVSHMQETTDELQARGEQVSTEVGNAVDLDTGAIVDSDAVGAIMADTASALEIYYDALSNIKAPSVIGDAHNLFVDAAGTRLEQWQTMADQATEFESIEELGEATRKSPTFQAACMALERAVDDAGLLLNMDCGDL